ncbi:FBD-associated F-box protein [Striga asiatica]|uniref:FBD-associated F-box protein n=1 Tax=Striga asiatica TaxID=4170 RepID=A0A5A7R6E3_STRAF|nr:FBD-associated F-box protein [Striga asiatica]
MAAAPIDRLSALPDDILSQILFLLPTKGSVSTSTLATRWRHLWAHAPNLEFEDTFSENFKTLMSQCAAHNSAVTLRLFVTSRAHSKKFKSINTAIASNPKALDLSFGYDGRVIPLSVFTSKTLVDLRLVRCRTEIRKNEATTRLPALKRLHLERVTLDESLEKVLSGCPVLEELTIKQNLPLCKIRRQDGTPICLPALKRLHLECVELGDSFMNLIYGCPGLEELTVRKNLPNSVNDKSIIMCLPALKRLRLECVELCGGSLESLHIYCPMVSVLAIEGNILSNMFTYETIVDLTVASRKDFKQRRGEQVNVVR